MTTRPLARIGAATILAIGLLAATAAPAAASTVQLDIAASSTLAMGSSNTHFGGHPTANVCAPGSSTSSISPDITGTAITLESSDYAFPWIDAAILSSTPNSKLRILPTSTTTVGSMSSGGTVSLPLSFRLEFRTCDSSVVVCTTNTMTMTLSTTTYAGSHPPVTSDTLTLTGTSTAITVPIGCNTVFRAAISGLAITLSLNLHVA